MWATRRRQRGRRERGRRLQIIHERKERHWTERWGLREEGGWGGGRWDWQEVKGFEETVMKRVRREQSPNDDLFNLSPFSQQISLPAPPSSVRYPPLPLSPSPSPSLSLHQASEAKLHLINNGCCCLLHCWRRAGTLGNAGATFNWMGLLMRPAGETPPPLPVPPPSCNSHIHAHTNSPIHPPHFASFIRHHAMQLFPGGAGGVGAAFADRGSEPAVQVGEARPSNGKTRAACVFQWVVGGSLVCS